MSTLDKDDDHRYTITVYLVRDKRPKYWDFHCPYCAAKVAELDGQLVNMTDITANPQTRVRCPGTSKKWCRMWYEFQVSG